MPQLDKLSFITQIFWLSLFFFSLYFFVVNFFVSNIFKGLKLKFIIYKNCNFITQYATSLSNIEFGALTAAYLNVLRGILMKSQYFVNAPKNITNNTTISICALNYETNSIEEEDLYVTDLTTLIALRVLENEI